MAHHASKKAASFLVICTAIAIAILTPFLVSGRAFDEGATVVWVFDVGQGDAIFIDAPGAQVLIDGGPNDLVVEKLTHVMAPWDRTIDAVINTHPHADHVTGLVHVLERYDVLRLYDSGQNYWSDVYKEFDTFNPQTLAQGDVIELGEGVALRILWPRDAEGKYLKDPNAGSVVALLEAGGTFVLLTGDAGAAEEAMMLEDIPDIDVLKVGHHGSTTATSEDLLRIAKPEIAVISLGEGNSYGHPHRSVVARLEKMAQVLRTDRDGDIRIRLKGGVVDVKTFDF